MSKMNDFDKDFNRTSKIITAIAFTIITIIVLGAIFVIGLGIKGCKEVREHGLKNVGEQIWNGPTNATPAVTNTITISKNETTFKLNLPSFFPTKK